MNGSTGKRRICAMLTAAALLVSPTALTTAIAQQDSGAPPRTAFSPRAASTLALATGDIVITNCAIPNHHDTGAFFTATQNGSTSCFAAAQLLTITDGSTGGNLNKNNISVETTGGSPVKLRLDKVSTQVYTVDYSSRSPIEVHAGAKLDLTISGENSLSCMDNTMGSGSDGKYGAGIYVPEGAALTIRAASNVTDRLVLTAGKDGSGIGGINHSGDADKNCGDITILGGSLDVKYRLGMGAGIGAGPNGACKGTITIGGNAVVKSSGDENVGRSKVGIGSDTASAGTIIIEGDAKITTGYGGSIGGAGGDITIRGNAKVEASGVSGSAAIGGVDGASVDSITIAGNASVRAIGSSEGGAGIGGGKGSDGGKITIAGGNVSALANNSGGSSTLGAAIGGGKGGDGGEITISGGVVDARGKYADNASGKAASAAIGGGDGGDGGEITITGGVVTADLVGAMDNPVVDGKTRPYSGKAPALIGGGAGGAAGDITISGGTVFAYVSRTEHNSMYAVELANNVYEVKKDTAALGKGAGGAATGSVTITGGNVVAGIMALQAGDSDIFTPHVSPKPTTVFTPVKLDGKAYLNGVIDSMAGLAYGGAEDGFLVGDFWWNTPYLCLYLPASVKNANVTVEGRVSKEGAVGEYGEAFVLKGTVTAGTGGVLKADKRAVKPTLTSKGDVVYSGKPLTADNFLLDKDGSTGAVSYYYWQSNFAGNPDTDRWAGPALPDGVGEYMVKAELADTATHQAGVTNIVKIKVLVNNRIPTGNPGYTRITTAGKTLADAKLTVGTMKPAGTIQWVDANGKALPLTTRVVKGTHYRWLFTPNDSKNYDTREGTILLWTNRTPTGSPGYTRITTAGKTLADAKLTVGTLQPAGTIKWVTANGADLPLTTEVKQGVAYWWKFTPDNTKDYDAASGLITLWPASGGGGGSSGGSGGGGGTVSVAEPVSPSVGANGAVSGTDAAKEATRAVKDALAKAPGKAVNAPVTLQNAQSISPTALAAIANAAKQAGGSVTLRADTTENGRVVGRISFDPAKAAGLKADVKLSVRTDSAATSATKSRFERYFSNKLAVVSLAQQGSFGMAVDVAARVDLTGLNTKTLYLYSFDKATNKYYPIPAKGAWVDANGYLRFTTTRGGDILVTDKPLAAK